MVLPQGTTLPPLPYAAAILVGAAIVVGLLGRARPRIDGPTVVALAPWMAVGSALYVAYELGVSPPSVAPAFSSPAVYLTTFVVAGAVWWLAVRVGAPVPATLATTGVLVFLLPAGAVIAYGLDRGTLAVAWPLVALVVAVGLAAIVWGLLRACRSLDAAVVGGPGALVVLGHALDGVSTAVGVDVLGAGERTPLSRLVLDLGGALPTAPYVGRGWLFVLVKVTLAAAICLLLADYVREEPAEGYVLLAFVAAVGLGPGVHNVLLFAATAGA